VDRPLPRGESAAGLRKALDHDGGLVSASRRAYGADMNVVQTKRKTLSLEDAAALAEKLRSERRSLLGTYGCTGEDLDTIEATRETELEDRSQEEAASEMLVRLGERDFAELREIEGALHRVRAGTYGSCVTCSAPIALGRLRAKASVANCSACADHRDGEAHEKWIEGTHHDDDHEHAAEVPPELRMMDDVELATLVRETLGEEVGEALASVRVACRHGRVILGGEVASDELRQVAKRIVEDEIGLEVSDRLRVGMFGEESRGRRPRRPGETLGALLGTGERTVDVFEVEEEGLDYTPPTKPVPEFE
jgi:RNA polymerase-binding transcription factor DksA